jgi:hypothetical protein
MASSAAVAIFALSANKTDKNADVISMTKDLNATYAFDSEELLKETHSMGFVEDGDASSASAAAAAATFSSAVCCEDAVTPAAL